MGSHHFLKAIERNITMNKQKTHHSLIHPDDNLSALDWNDAKCSNRHQRSISMSPCFREKFESPDGLKRNKSHEKLHTSVVTTNLTNPKSFTSKPVKMHQDSRPTGAILKACLVKTKTQDISKNIEIFERAVLDRKARLVVAKWQNRKTFQIDSAFETEIANLRNQKKTKSSNV
jgi:hypothetical protein